MEEINKIREKLKTANRLYRDGNPIMSDTEYDALEQELKMLNPDDEWFKRGVNDDKPKNREMVLPHPMMSLDKVKNYNDLQNWMKKFSGATFVVTPKYDGLSVGMSNEKSWTRGDGTIGQDCSEHVSAVYIKPTIENEIVVRGEIIIDNMDWGKFKQINEGAKSQRNSATGLINGDFDRNRLEEYSLLRVMPYEIQGSDLSKERQLGVLLNQNFCKITNPIQLTEGKLLSLYMDWKKLYPIDGLVIDVNEEKYRHGVEANGNPSYSIAYKHPSFSEVGYGVIDSIERSVNRDGVVTPVIVLKEPINLSGADIQRVNGINMRYVHDWMLYPGERVTVIRSGEVIPKIIGVGDVKIPFKDEFKTIKEYDEAYAFAVSERRKDVTLKMVDNYEVSVLDECPICGCQLEPLYGPEGEWCEMVCTNPKCDGQILAGIVKFFEIAGIDGFGSKTFEQLFEAGVVRNEYDAFRLDYDDLIILDGWAEKSVDNFLSEMKRIRTSLSFARFLHATGWFADLGEKTLQKILDADGWGKDDYELIEIEGVQQITADKFLSGYEMYNKNESTVQRLFKFAYIKTPKNGGKLNGLVACATGFRDQVLFKEIKDNGGIVSDGVTKETNCLIVKDLNSTSSKVKKAEKMGIEILDINGFKEKYMI